MTRQEGRNVAEWTTFAGSCVILMIVAALIAYQLRDPLAPATPVAATTGEVRAVGDRHHVGVVVTNGGDVTAANVQISAELVVGDDSTTADQTIDFLAGGEEVDLVFVFEDDPAGGDLTVTVTGYSPSP